MGNMVVVMQDGTKYEVKIKPADIVQFERKFNIPVSKLNEEQRYEWLLYLAWLGAKRNGVTEDYLQAARAEARRANSTASDVEDDDDVVVEYRH